VKLHHVRAGGGMAAQPRAAHRRTLPFLCGRRHGCPPGQRRVPGLRRAAPAHSSGGRPATRGRHDEGCRRIPVDPGSVVVAANGIFHRLVKRRRTTNSWWLSRLAPTLAIRSITDPPQRRNCPPTGEGGDVVTTPADVQGPPTLREVPDAPPRRVLETLFRRATWPPVTEMSDELGQPCRSRPGRGRSAAASRLGIQRRSPRRSCEPGRSSRRPAYGAPQGGPPGQFSAGVGVDRFLAKHGDNRDTGRYVVLCTRTGHYLALCSTRAKTQAIGCGPGRCLKSCDHGVVVVDFTLR